MSRSNPGAITVRFRGVRGSTPSPGLSTARYGGNTSCVELRTGKDILILDAGSGLRSLGADLKDEFGLRPIEATLLISHTHWDHIQGFPFFTPAFSANNRIRILAPKGAGDTVRRALTNQMDPIHFPVSLEQMSGIRSIAELDSNKVAIGAFTVHVTQLNHPGGCAGFRVETDGASLAYLPDHEPFGNDFCARMQNDALAEFIRGVELLILDTQYTDAEYSQRRGWGHGCLHRSVALARDAGVKQLLLFHHDPGHDDDQIDAMVETAFHLVRPSAITIKAASEDDVVELLSSPGRASTPSSLNTAAA